VRSIRSLPETSTPPCGRKPSMPPPIRTSVEQMGRPHRLWVGWDLPKRLGVYVCLSHPAPHSPQGWTTSSREGRSWDTVEKAATPPDPVVGITLFQRRHSSKAR
jgi:hypothetical protein